MYEKLLTNLEGFFFFSRKSLKHITLYLANYSRPSRRWRGCVVINCPIEGQQSRWSRGPVLRSVSCTLRSRWDAFLGFLGVRVKAPVGREIRPDYREEKYTQERSFSSAAPVLNYMTGNKTLRESARSLPLVFTKLQICPPRLTK